MRGEQACLGRVRGTDFLEGWNTKIASGMRERTHLCGNIASLSTMARSRPSPCPSLEVFKAALKGKSTRQSGFLPTLLNHILNSKSEFHEAPIVRVVTTNGLKTEQGEEEVVVRGRGGGRRAERGQ